MKKNFTQILEVNVKFSIGGLTSGVYLYRLNANGTTQTRKLTVMK